jgi:hypothetical protein
MIQFQLAYKDAGAGGFHLSYPSVSKLAKAILKIWVPKSITSTGFITSTCSTTAGVVILSGSLTIDGFQTRR